MIPPEVIDALRETTQWLLGEIRTPWFVTQMLIVVSLGLLALWAATALRRRIDLVEATMGWPTPLRLLARTLVQNAGIVKFMLLAVIARAILAPIAPKSSLQVLSMAISLALAWLIIRAAASVIRNQTVVLLVSISAWIVAALNIVGLLDDTVAFLDSTAIKIGTLRLSPLMAIKIVVLAAITLWLANTLSRFLQTRLDGLRDLTPSVRELIGKVLHLFLIGLAVLAVMSMAGIDLSALAIFSGAVGVGFAFGLQKIVGNYVSGIILLADKSIKPGDLVTVGENFGRVSAMKTRYISVASGDGREFLVPNEDLITQKVVNWTLRDRDTLIEVKFMATYDADPTKVCQIAVAVAQDHRRAIPARAVTCHVTEFADHGIRYSLTFWIGDPEAGMSDVRSDVLIALWTAFKREGISVPVPIREVRVSGDLFRHGDVTPDAPSL